MVRHPALNNQRAAAFFLSLGHYDSFMMHLHRIFRDRWTELRLALNFSLVEHFETTRAQGHTTGAAGIVLIRWLSADTAAQNFC